MATTFDPKASPAAGATGADLNTDSTGEVFTPPLSGAGVSTVGLDGYGKGYRLKAPDAGMTRGVRDATVHGYLKDNAQKHDLEPSQMDPFEVLAGLFRAGDARADMLARGAVEAGSAAEVVASADRAGEPSMEELLSGKGNYDILGDIVTKQNQRIKDIT